MHNGRPGTQLSRYVRLIAAGCALLVALETSVLHAAPPDELLTSLSPTAGVNDYAGILAASERESLEQRCRKLREKTGAQLAVVVLKSLEGGQIDDFTVKLFKQWGVGEPGRDNGVMLLVALDDRKARIEVGYGLEPALPDVLAGRLLRDELFPAFKQQHYFAGLSATVSRISEIVERNEPAPQRTKVFDPGAAGGILCIMLFLIPFVSFPSFFVGVLVRAKKYVKASFPTLFTGFGFLFANAAGLPWVVLLVLGLFAVAAAVFGYFAKQLPPWGGRRGRPTGNAWPAWDWGGTSWTGGNSTWTGGGFGGGGGGDWGGFGGGSSGGGGASGGW